MESHETGRRGGRHWRPCESNCRRVKTSQGAHRLELKRALPAERFPFCHEGQRSVHRHGHVEVDKAY
jgi:hypothetical protein